MAVILKLFKKNLSKSRCVLACENIRFSSLFVAEDVSRGNVLSDEERGETDVFAG